MKLLEKMTADYRTKEIEWMLHISRWTFKCHLERILAKLGRDSGSQTERALVQHGIVRWEE